MMGAILKSFWVKRMSKINGCFLFCIRSFPLAGEPGWAGGGFWSLVLVLVDFSAKQVLK